MRDEFSTGTNADSEIGRVGNDSNAKIATTFMKSGQTGAFSGSRRILFPPAWNLPGDHTNDRDATLERFILVETRKEREMRNFLNKEEPTDQW